MTRALLSRVAESIFWVGRYVERAEGTARILDVSVYQALEQSDVEGSASARRLLAVMGLPDSGTETLWQATERLATDPRSRSSIAGALAAARENTRAVRHVVPVEFWEHINATWSELPMQWQASRQAGPASHLSFVKTQCAGMMGLADTMMSRDQTWLFFTLGRCLERTDVVARQLATVAFDEVHDSGLVLLLRSCGGYEPYLRLSQGVVGARARPRLPSSGPALSALGVRVAHPGRGLPGPDQRRPRRHLGGRPWPDRAGAGRARVLRPATLAGGSRPG